jgi:soluble cytochrome b562
MSHPIQKAIEPFREKAMKKAESLALKQIENVKQKLIEFNGDRNQFAPMPKGVGERSAYIEKKNYYHFVQSITESTVPQFQRWNSEDKAQINEKRCLSFIEKSKEMASKDFSKFVDKLISKIGDCDSAQNEGDLVWNFSILTVSKQDKIEKWKTQIIMNISKHGKLFNQYPTRKMK